MDLHLLFLRCFSHRGKGKALMPCPGPGAEGGRGSRPSVSEGLETREHQAQACPGMCGSRVHVVAARRTTPAGWLAGLWM